MPPRRVQGRFIFFIFLAGLLIRTLYIFQIFRFPLTEYFTASNVFDQYGFNETAGFIASGNWSGPGEVFGKEPLYPYFLAVIYRVFGYSHFAVYLMQAILTSLGVVLVYKVSRQIFNTLTACIASFIMAFYSMSIFYDALLLRASLIGFLNILLFYLLIKACSDNKSCLWLCSGGVLGLSVLTRHNMLLLFIVPFMLFSLRPFRTAARAVLILVSGLVIVLLPVIIRNYIISEKERICISWDSSAFWVGNTYDSAGVDLEWSDEYYRLERSSEGSLIKTAGLFFNELKKRPKAYLKLYLRKTWMFFNGYEVPSNTNYYLYREEFPTVLRWPLFNFQLICSLAIVGFFLSLMQKHRPYLAYVFLMVLSFSVILFHIQSRYRVPAIPFFIIFASYSVYYLFENIRKKAFLRSIAIVSVVIFLHMILRPDLSYAGFRDKGWLVRPQDRINLALAYMDEHKRTGEKAVLELALRQCNIAAEQEKTSYLPYGVRAHIYLLEGRYEDSINEYKTALIHDGRNPFLYNELAGVYFQQNESGKAFIFTKRALHLFPENSLFKKNLGMIPEA